jgi:putative Ca2+/H+ antiporter (TMEM165/GDT1 family)
MGEEALNFVNLNVTCVSRTKKIINGSTSLDKELEKVASNKEVSFTTVMVTTFTTVFLAELGDKTQLATLLLSAQSGQPWVVFLGAAIALISASLVGVLVGRWLASILPPERLEKMAGVLMVGLGLWLGIQATQSLILANN